MKQKLDDFLSVEQRATVTAVVSLPSEKFNDLCAVAALDPTTDFRGADLTGIDFTDADLRGFDFSNADLSDCYGTQVCLDATTVLDGADLHGSVFALEGAHREFFKENPQWEDEYRRARASYWSEQSLWISERVGKARSSKEQLLGTRRVAERLYHAVQDRVVKNDILYGLGRLYAEDKNGYRDFIFSILARPSENSSVISSALSIAASTFKDTSVGFRFLITFAQDEDARLAFTAFKGLLASRKFSDERKAVASIVNSKRNNKLLLLLLQQLARRNNLIRAYNVLAKTKPGQSNELEITTEGIERTSDPLRERSKFLIATADELEKTVIKAENDGLNWGLPTLRNAAEAARVRADVLDEQADRFERSREASNLEQNKPKRNVLRDISG